MLNELSFIAQFVVTAITTLVASSGFWLYLVKRMEKRHELEMKQLEKRDALVTLVTGIAHDKILHLGLQYIHRGSITHEEYETLFKYLYIPYKDLGGNGTAKRVIEEVATLPFKHTSSITDVYPYSYNKQNNEE